MRRAVLVVVLSFVLPAVASAQVIDETRWVPNGPVNAVARHEGITYVGGNFTMVSPPSGAAVPANQANGVVPGGFPAVVGRVFCVIPDGAGGWILGGLFTTVGGQSRNNIARINSDFSVNAWNPNANNAVLALQLSFAGTVYAGGDFSVIGGQPRARLAELDLATGNATAMVVTPNSTVRSLTYNNSSIYAGGDFTFVNGVARNHACAVSVTTRAFLAWNPNVNGTVYAVMTGVRPGPVVKMLIGGSFTTVGGQPRTNLAEVDVTLGTPTGYNPSPNGTVRAIDNRNGIDYVGGDFTTLAGFTRNHLGAVDGVTGQATAWNPDVDGPVEALAWTNAGWYYVGGTFENVGGAPHRNAAKIEVSTGAVQAWDPMPNNTVHAIALGSIHAYVGGEFTGLGGVPRLNAYAYDDWAHAVTTWDPHADGAVACLAIRSFGPVVYAVYLGGAFTNVQGQPRAHLAAVQGKTGVPLSWTANTDQPVSALAVNDTMVAFGGFFTTTDGEATGAVAAKRHTGGPVIHFDGVNVGANVFALAMSSTMLHVGGTLGFARSDLATHAVLANQNPATNGAVRTLLARTNTIYAGGDFTTVGGNPRNRLVKFTNNTTIDGWNPGADGIVRALAQGETGLLVGGDFLNAGGAPRWRLAQIDQATGTALPWAADVADREVVALAARGPQVDLGGTFHGMAASPVAGYAVVANGFPQLCGASISTFVGGRPRALAVLDANADGKDDIAVVQDGGAIPHVYILDGNGAGLFSLVQALNFGGTPMTVTAADFDADGRADLAVTENDDAGNGLVRLFHNASGTFQPWTVVPLMGRGDGLAAGDFDQDGIVDLAACLIDSASTIKRGGLEFFKGGGTNGTWDGTFTYTDKSHQLVWAASARRVVAHDFDQDGITDFFYMGQTTSPLLVFVGTDLKVNCQQVVADFPYPRDGFGLAYGDFNEDGRSDIVFSQGRSLVVRFKNETVGCGFFFQQTDQMSVALPSTPHDLAVMDVDQDGILDVVCAFDSLSTLAVCRGGGLGGVPDGTLLPPVTLDTHDVWDIGLGDFVADGITDVATSMATCGYMSVWQNSGSPLFPMTITLDSPNGGESLARTPPPVLPSEAVALPEDEGAFVTTASSKPSEIASLRTIAWTKGAGIHGVDVELSRNDGATWQMIGKNVAGGTMTWYSTPPASSTARVRVRDSAYRSRMDASDAPFSIIAGLVGAPPPGAPLTAGLALLGQHPAHGAVRFMLDVPAAAEVAVVLFDAGGRRVRTLASGRYAPGSHGLAWDGTDDHGAGCRRGVYFVRTRIGGYEASRKVVML